MANMSLTKCPMPSQDPEVRSHNFDEVALGYTAEMAVEEAKRCLNCPKKPCHSGCPVGIDIPAFIGKVAEEDFAGAYEVLERSTTLAAVCGRVCPQESQCEGKCVRGIKGEPVAIGRLERFVADWHREHAHEEPVKAAPNGHKVAVVGSGPSGLTCAGDLAKLGYAVTVFEALHTPGGVLVYGIPEFRLPKELVRKEIATLEAMGVEFQTNMVIGKVLTVDELMEDMGYECVYLASGAGLPSFMGIPGETLNGVYSANEYLTRVNLMKAYRPDSHTPIAKSNPVEVLGDETGHVKGMKCIQMELGEPDASGRRRPVPIPDSEFVLDVDTMIMSIGTSPNPLIRSTTPGLETNKHGCIVTNGEDGLTSRTGVYAGGDAVTGAATVILAMGAGKQAAAAIHKYIQEK